MIPPELGTLAARAAQAMPESDRPLVIQTEQLDEQAAAWLSQRCTLVRAASDSPEFAELLPKADALLIRTYTNVNEELLAKAPRLKAVARAGVGLDNVDQAACKRRGIAVISTPGANTRAVVELVTAFMLDALRPREYLTKALDSKAWAELRKRHIGPRQLEGMTLGIVGFGRVGSAVARIGAAMNMRVIYNDLIEIPPSARFGATPGAFKEVCSQADVLTIHVDGRKENRHLVGDVLAGAKPDLILINTSRGFVLDTAKVAAFLRAHPEASAWIDVHDPEPFGPDYPLLGLPNAHLTAHIGAATAQAHANMSWVVKDLWKALSVSAK
jgi:phosphoglycerate dehydrogenase-like enzyme